MLVTYEPDDADTRSGNEADLRSDHEATDHHEGRTREAEL
jgi:hypothetical protein